MNQMSAAPYAASARQGPRALVFTRDEDAAGVIRQALSDLGADAVFKSEGVGGAMNGLAGRVSPRLLIVDVSGEADPVARVRELAQTCEPSTALVVTGDTNDIRLYRGILDAGASEYFFKPLVTTLVARACRMILTGADEPARSRTGRMVFVVGVRGGCGATTIAVRTAWRLCESPPRPVLLLDLDLSSGDAALQLDATPNYALSEALAQVDRVDDLFLERGLIHATKRLDLMASLAALDEPSDFAEEALLSLLDKVTRRYRYVVAEIPPWPAPALSRALHLPSTLLLVSDGRLVSAREVARWRHWLGASGAERTVMHVLNMSGAPGSLPLADFTRAAGQAPDVVIPYAREVGAASLLGLEARPECPPLDRGLAPIIGMLSGEAAEPKPSFLKRMMR